MEHALRIQRPLIKRWIVREYPKCRSSYRSTSSNTKTSGGDGGKENVAKTAKFQDRFVDKNIRFRPLRPEIETVIGGGRNVWSLTGRFTHPFAKLFNYSNRVIRFWGTMLLLTLFMYAYRKSIWGRDHPVCMINWYWRDWNGTLDPRFKRRAERNEARFHSPLMETDSADLAQQKLLDWKEAERARDKRTIIDLWKEHKEKIDHFFGRRKKETPADLLSIDESFESPVAESSVPTIRD